MKQTTHREQMQKKRVIKNIDRADKPNIANVDANVDGVDET